MWRPNVCRVKELAAQDFGHFCRRYHASSYGVCPSGLAVASCQRSLTEAPPPKNTRPCPLLTWNIKLALTAKILLLPGWNGRHKLTEVSEVAPPHISTWYHTPLLTHHASVSVSMYLFFSHPLPTFCPSPSRLSLHNNTQLLHLYVLFFELWFI